MAQYLVEVHAEFAEPLTDELATGVTSSLAQHDDVLGDVPPKVLPSAEGQPTIVQFQIEAGSNVKADSKAQHIVDDTFAERANVTLVSARTMEAENATDVTDE